MPLAVRERLARIRDEGRRPGSEGGRSTATTVTLDAKGMPAWDALAAIEKQTGNRVVDHREQGGDAAASQPTVTATFKDEPYWSAVDRVARSGESRRLRLRRRRRRWRSSNARRATDRGRATAIYGGPFRIEAIEIQAQRNLRKADRNSLKLQLEVAWEPRLRPIAVSQVGD